MTAPKITVFTPCFNSARTLHRTWESLLEQDPSIFEWVVIDDGSTDGSFELLRAWVREAPFAARAIRYGTNVGLAHTYNHAVGLARGTYFAKADSDDWIVPGALALMADRFESTPPEVRHTLGAVSGRCRDSRGPVLGDPSPRPDLVCGHLEYMLRYSEPFERWGLILLEALRRHSFPSAVDRHVPEGYVWARLGEDHPFLYIDDVVRIYDTDNPDSMTWAPLKRFPRGATFFLVDHLDRSLRLLLPRPVRLLKELAGLGREARNADIRPGWAIAQMQGLLPRILAWLALPLGLVLARRDRARGRLAPDRWTGPWPTDSLVRSDGYPIVEDVQNAMYHRYEAHAPNS